LKAAGGQWNPEEKLCRVPFGSIRGDAEFKERILSIETMSVLVFLIIGTFESARWFPI
jgi:hypothetical protein